MNEKKIEEAISNLISDRTRFWKADEVDSFLTQQGIRIDDEVLLTLLERLSEDNIFKWLDYVSFKLMELASTEDRFINLLKKIVLKIKGDMAQGPFIRALIKIGSKDHELGVALFEKMEVQDGDLIFYSSFPLGGSGKIKFGDVFQTIQEKFESNDPNLKATCIRALRVIFEEDDHLKEDQKIFEMLDRASIETEDVVVRNEATNAFIDFNKVDSERCTRALIKLAQQCPDIRFNLANRLLASDLARSADTINILKICSQDNDNQVLDRVSQTLAKRGKDYPEESLDIVKDWIKRDVYFKIPSRDFCLQELGKADLNKCLEVVETWIEQEKEPKFMFFMPTILREMCSNDYGLLLKFLEKWSNKNNSFQRITLETMREMLSFLYQKENESTLVDKCFSLLKDMAQIKNIDVTTSIRGEQEKIFQCCRIMEEIVLDRKAFDFNKIESNLENYLAIKDFLGIIWFREKREENNKIHPLLINLSYASDDDKKSQLFLNCLNEMIDLIAQGTNRVRSLKLGLQNEDQFSQTVSEIEIISAFINEWPIEVEPDIDGKKLDLKVETNEADLLIEVINPEMFKPLKFFRSARGIPNRARSKIYDEFKAHLKDKQIEGDAPIVIVIDIGRSEIDYEFVEDYLMGTLQLTMVFEEKKKEIVGTYPSRAKDSMHDRKGEMDLLSAVICYQTVFGSDDKLHIQGRIIPNKYAKNPLGPQLTEIVKKNLFR